MAYFLYIPFRFFKLFWTLQEISTEFLQKLSHISLKSFFLKIFPIFLNVPQFLLHLHFFKICPTYTETFSVL